MNIIRIAKLGLFAATALVALPVSAQVTLVSDTFALNGTTRVNGTFLNGQSAEIYNSTGSGNWVATIAQDRTVFSSTGTIVSNTNGYGMENRIAFAAPTNKIVTISVDAITGGAQSSWVAVGFAPEAQSGQQLFTSGQSSLWVALRPTGGFNVYTDGATSIKSGSVATLGDGFSTTEFYNIALSYDPNGNLAELVITDSSNNQFSTGWFSTGNIASIGAGAFKLNGSGSYPVVAGQVQFDNFKVTSVPEPDQAGMIIGIFALIMLCAQRYHRR